MEYVVIYVFFFMSIVAHEVAHGWAAFKLGDPTAYHLGRLTFNPIPHIDPMMTIVLPIVTMYTLGFPFGGAKPVPINPFQFRNPSKGMMITSLAGPLTNVMIGIFFTIVVMITMNLKMIGVSGAGVLITVSLLNFFLAMFNMIPIPPLDGSRVLRHFMPENIQRTMDQMERYGIMAMIILLTFFRGPLFAVFDVFRKAYLDLILPT